jgi:hypothetical protein
MQVLSLLEFPLWAYGVKNVPYQGKGQNHIDIPRWLDLVASMGDMLAHMQSGFKISNPPRFHLH